MNIWLINPYGPIPGEGWRDYRFTLLGEALAEHGHNVTWWTANFSHHFKRFRSETWQDRQVSSGFNIRLVPTTAYTKNISLGRIWFEIAYAWRAYRRARLGPSPDLIVGTDPSQIIGFLSVRLARRFSVPLILDVFDLWPELFVLAFPKRMRPLATLVLSPFHILRRHNLRRADAVTALCDTYADVAKRVTSRPSLTAFNGIDVKVFRALLPKVGEASVMTADWGKKPGDIWAVFAGSLGNNYDIPTLLRAANYLEANTNRVKISIVGEGPLRPLVTHFVQAEHPRNLTYLGKLQQEMLIKLYGICDIGLCPYGPDSNVAMPDKVYDYMAAGLPIISSLRGELENFLRDRQIGIQYQAGDPKSLADALESLAADEERRVMMARNSYNAAMQFDRHVQYQKFVDLVEQVAAT